MITMVLEPPGGRLTVFLDDDWGGTEGLTTEAKTCSPSTITICCLDGSRRVSVTNQSRRLTLPRNGRLALRQSGPPDPREYLTVDSWCRRG